MPSKEKRRQQPTITFPGWCPVLAGIYTNNFSHSLNTKDGFPVFSTVIEAVHLKKQTDLVGASASQLTDEDKQEIKECASCELRGWAKGRRRG